MAYAVLPDVGESFRLFGMRVLVTVVEPEDDWTWRVEGTTRLGAGEDTRTVSLLVPSASRTT